MVGANPTTEIETTRREPESAAGPGHRDIKAAMAAARKAEQIIAERQQQAHLASDDVMRRRAAPRSCGHCATCAPCVSGTRCGFLQIKPT